MKRTLTPALVAGILLVSLLPGPLLAQRSRIAILDANARQSLITALTGPNGEYAARAEYAAILAAFGAGTQPYANLLAAENKHVRALQQQCQKFGIPVPEDTYWGKVIVPPSLLEAAETAVMTETLNVVMYGELLMKVKPYPSLVQVFTNLRAASLNNHLPALEAAVQNGGALP